MIQSYWHMGLFCFGFTGMSKARLLAFHMPFVNLTELTVREPFPGFRVQFVHSEFMTFAHWKIRAGALLPQHSHPHEQVANVLEGEFELTIDGNAQTLGPGSVGIIPPNAIHSGKAITDCWIIDAFYPIREDYRMPR